MTNTDTYSISNLGETFNISPYTVKDMKNLLIHQEDEEKKNYLLTINAILSKYCFDKNNNPVDWLNKSEALVTFVFMKLRAISSSSDASILEKQCDECDTIGEIKFDFNKIGIEYDEAQPSEVRVSDKKVFKTKLSTFENKIQAEEYLFKMRKLLEKKASKSLKTKIDEFKKEAEEQKENLSAMEIFEEEKSIKDINLKKIYIALSYEEKILDIINSIQEVQYINEKNNTKIIDFKDILFDEKKEIVENLAEKEMEILSKYIEKSPLAKLVTDFSCLKCGYSNKEVRQGFNDFF